MARLLLLLALSALAFGDDSDYCDTVTNYIPTNIVHDEPIDFDKQRCSVTRCKPALLKQHRKIELDSYHSHMIVIGRFQDGEEGRKVRVIEDDTFYDLKDLEYLILKGLDAEEVQPHAFRGLDSLQVLSLSDNSLTSLPAEIFEDLPKLKEIKLIYNKIEQIDAHLFDKATNLERLDLGENRLAILPANWAGGLSKLKVLIVSASSLAEIQSGAFDGLSELRELDLATSDIDTIEEDAFRGLENLESLHLEFNYEMDFKLSHELERHLKSLKKINLAYSGIRCDDLEKAKSIMDERKIQYVMAEAASMC